MKEKFELAREEVQKLKSKPNNTELLKLYGLYKQATEGDVKGDRPGTFDIKGQFKYDLNFLEEAIKKNDGIFLQELFTKTRGIRKEIVIKSSKSN